MILVLDGSIAIAPIEYEVSLSKIGFHVVPALSVIHLYKKERVRVAGVDTPEKRTRDLEEKALGLDATNWMKEQLEGAIDGDDELTIRTELVGGMGKYGRLLGWLYVGDADTSLNEQMITEGYAWSYDGGTKQKNFEELREIRRSFGTLQEG